MHKVICSVHNRVTYEWLIVWQYQEQYFKGLSEGEKSEASIRNRLNNDQKAQNKIRNPPSPWDLLARSRNSPHKGKCGKTRGAQLHPCTFSTPGKFTCSVCICVFKQVCGVVLTVKYKEVSWNFILHGEQFSIKKTPKRRLPKAYQKWRSCYRHMSLCWGDCLTVAAKVYHKRALTEKEHQKWNKDHT